MYEKGKCISPEGREVRIYGFAVAVKKTYEAEIEHARMAWNSQMSEHGGALRLHHRNFGSHKKQNKTKKIVITTVVYSISACELTQLVTKLQVATRSYVRN